MSLPQRSEIVIIGGGVIGASIAYHLAERGKNDVTLVERKRMSEIFRIRTRYQELWDAEKKLLPVEVTSAVELDEATVRSIGERIGSGTGNSIQLTTIVDPDIGECAADGAGGCTDRRAG